MDMMLISLDKRKTDGLNKAHMCVRYTPQMQCNAAVIKLDVNLGHKMCTDVAAYTLLLSES